MKINYKGAELTIVGSYIENKDGDYLTPNSPDQYEIEEIYWNGHEVTYLIADIVGFDEIEAVCLDKIYFNL